MVGHDSSIQDGASSVAGRKRVSKSAHVEQDFEELVGEKRTFVVEEKLADPRFSAEFVIEMSGRDFNLAHVQKHGFNSPLLFKSKEGLHLKVPPPDFSVKDVRACVGSRRILDVMDTTTQRNVEMTMKQWHKYWERPRKDQILNVISLEFSHTRLENYVKAPLIVRQLDWTDRVWPRHLKLMQTESTNVLERMMYPKVQKYVLMSVKGCYTDFHIDFGGTSVWYHILKGEKIFFLIPPSKENLRRYESWTLSGKQSEQFFGDLVDKCCRIRLEAGNTFFIPTGWIHAVYTPQDSLIFGGNFLHSFGIERQLEIATVEDLTHVPQKFRYPFFTEMLWYVLDRYVSALLGRSYICGMDCGPKKGAEDDCGENKENNEAGQKPHVHLTPNELHGLKAIIVYLHRLPAARKNIPDVISDPVALIKDVRRVVVEHKDDDPAESVTGRPLLVWPEEYSSLDDVDQRRRDVKAATTTPTSDDKGGGKREKNYRKKGAVARKRALLKDKEVKLFKAKKPNVKRRRRQRCRQCDACVREDCGKCVYCLDMTKFGGLCRLKQTCLLRQCTNPVLPHKSECLLCGRRDAGYGREGDINCGLYECTRCGDITHPQCCSRRFPGAEVKIVDEVTACWECTRCLSSAAGPDGGDASSVMRGKKWPVPRKQMRLGGAVKGPLTRPLKTKHEGEEENSDAGAGAKEEEEAIVEAGAVKMEGGPDGASAPVPAAAAPREQPPRPSRPKPVNKREPDSSPPPTKKRRVGRPPLPTSLRGKRTRRDSVDGSRPSLRPKK